MARSPRRQGATPVARKAPGKQINRGDEIAARVAKAGKATFVRFLAVPVLLILLIFGKALGAQTLAELASQVLGGVLAGVLTGALICCGKHRQRC
ncbi:hypothetical protein ABZ312_24570 [Streptomyces sp. NPDC006207]